MNRSLRTKILIILVGLLFLTVFANIFYSYQLFVNDKISYIFETGLRQSEYLNDQLNFKIKEFTTFLTLQENLVSDETNFEKVLGKNEDIISIGQVDREGKIVSILRNDYLVSRKKNSGTSEFEYSQGELFISPLKFREKNLSLVALNKNTKGYVYFKENRNGNFNFFFVTTESIDNIFKSNSLFTNMYLNLNGPNQIDAELATQIRQFPGQKGTMEFSSKQGELLVSFVKSNNESNAILSFIAKDKAFQVTSTLIIQSILFGLFLLGILVVIGVYFSNSITTPILELTRLSSEFSRGEFGNKFNAKTGDEISVLGSTFNNMSTEIESLLLLKEDMIKSKALIIKDLEEVTRKLEDANQNLEKRVKQRTAEIKRANVFMGAMVNSLDQGLMVFDRRLVCLDIYTTASEKIFNMVPRGKTLYEVLGIKSQQEIENIKKWAEIIFTEKMPFEHIAPLGPKSVVTGENYTQAHFKHIELNYRPMRDGKKIDNIVLVATDKTREISSTELSKEKEAYSNMIVKILNNKTQFQLFINDVRKMFGELKSFYSTETDTLDAESAMKVFHTLNGGFGLYNLFELQAIARENEFRVSDYKLKNIDIKDYPIHVERFKSAFESHIADIDTLLQTNFSTGNILREVETSKIHSLKDLVDKTGNIKLKEDFYAHLVNEPIGTYFSQYNDLVISLAKGSGKKVNGITIHNGDIKINPEPFMEFFSVLIHVFKNCLEHGIETESTRIKHGKPPEGHIVVDFSIEVIDDVSFLIVKIQDDGAGISAKRIKEKLIKMYPNENFDSLSNGELIQKIFDPFFTTTDKVSLHSGRGVGMSAVKDAVDHLGGKIDIESKTGKRTKFIFTIPIPA